MYNLECFPFQEEIHVETLSLALVVAEVLFLNSRRHIDRHLSRSCAWNSVE